MVCDCEPTRRDVLRTTALGAAALMAGSGAAALAARQAGAIAPGSDQSTASVAAQVAGVEVMPGLTILPRDAWGADLPPKSPSRLEQSKFLLVHHTASSNTYRSARDVIRSAYAFQTGSAKGWPDVCYGFFIGRDGDVWEGRNGALTRPVIADATGGNQGFAQLVCLLGDFTTTAPTAAAQASLVKMLAWLAGRDLISLADGATTTFVSRGSNRWPAGTTVTTPTIAGHRDMSATACPGDLTYNLLPDIRRRAREQAYAWRNVIRPAVRLGNV